MPLAWLVVGAAAWIVIAVGTALVIGRTVAETDRVAPRPPAPSTGSECGDTPVIIAAPRDPIDPTPARAEIRRTS